MVINNHQRMPFVVKFLEMLGLLFPISKRRQDPPPEKVDEVSFTLPTKSNLRLIIQVSIPETMFFRKLMKDVGSDFLIQGGSGKITIGDMLDQSVIGIGTDISLYLRVGDVGTINTENTLYIKLDGWTDALKAAPSTARKMKKANKIFRVLTSSGWEFVVPKKEEHKHLCGPFQIGREKSSP